MEQIWITASAWIRLALLASLISIRIALAMMESTGREFAACRKDLFPA